MIKPKILVVDDEETLRNLLKEILEEDKLDVETAINGQDALEKFKKRNHNIVFTDLKMPGISGVEVLKAVKDVDPDTEVVIITSNASLETATEAVRLGAYEYIIKPFENLNAVISLVYRAFEKYKLNKERKQLLEDLQRKNTELEHKNEMIKQIAVKDGLTQLYNQRHFKELLENELIRAKRHLHALSLIFFDVDYFKHYNDTNGHLMGDEALKTIGQLIKANVRGSDIPARYGGEEFVILLSETTLTDAIKFAERLRTAVELHPFQNDTSQPNGTLTISLGVVSYPKDGEDTTSLLQHVDEAMYRAKETGKNKVCTWAPSSGLESDKTLRRYLN